MGDSENKEQIVYTPEEENEIQRIVDFVETFSEVSSVTRQPAMPSVTPVIPEEKTPAKDTSLSFDLSQPDGRPPVDDDLLEGLSIDTSFEPVFETDDETADVDIETLPDSDLHEGEDEDEFFETEEPSEISGEPTGKKRISSLQQLDDLTADEPESLDLDEINRHRYVDIPEENEETEKPDVENDEEPAWNPEDFESGFTASSSDEDDLPISDDIEVLDDSAISLIDEIDEDLNNGDDSDIEPPNLEDIGATIISDLPEADSLDDLITGFGDDDAERDEPSEEAAEDAPEDKIDAAIESDFAVDDGFGEMPELGDLDDIQDVDDDFSGLAPSSAGEWESESDGLMRGSLMDELDQEDLSIDDKTDLSLMPEIDDTANVSDDFVVEPLGDDDDGSVDLVHHDVDEALSVPDDPEIDLSEKEIKKLRKAILLFDAGLRDTITDVVVNDRLPLAEIRTLVDMILKGDSESKIRDFLNNAGIEISESVRSSISEGHRVLHSRPEYMEEGRERQKKRLKFLALGGATVALAFIITILSYQYIYKPVVAKKKINEGIALIVRGGDYMSKPDDFRAAEALAQEVDENYIKDFVYAYNCYAAAYLQMKEYHRSYNKLNQAYRIEPQNIDTLLNLGHFYARVPAVFYNTVKSKVNENYYPSQDEKNREMPQLDLSINFYKRVLTISSNDVRALHGIGNAYFLQKQFLKAKNFYTDILSVDPNSIVGYSGLLNLYIERDSYELAAATHNELRYKKMLKKMPQALLAKLAGYYLTKNKTDSFNVRVDHGVQSGHLRDDDDNTLPAVKEVLRALNSIDEDYPPLILLRAKVSLFEKNIKAAERYLDSAIRKAPGYFDALHMRGKLYYDTSQPVKAYEMLNRAVSNYTDLSKANVTGGACECEGLKAYNYNNQPDFIYDDYYRQTERIGESHAILGNIFYYFFDRVKYRYGDLEDEMLDQELEKMANYNIAREKYELAVKENYGTSEVRYNLGRIHYLNKQYAKSLEQWLYLYDDFIENPELMLALGNAFYHLGQYDTAKGEFLKLINILEHETDGITIVDKGSDYQNKLFRSLAIAYNNIGSVYQLKNDESKSSLSYWKAIDYAKRIDIENEFARVNLARSFGRGNRVDPILDESVPYSIKFYNEKMRWSDDTDE